MAQYSKSNFFQKKITLFNKNKYYIVKANQS